MTREHCQFERSFKVLILAWNPFQSFVLLGVALKIARARYFPHQFSNEAFERKSFLQRHKEAEFE